MNVLRKTIKGVDMTIDDLNKADWETFNRAYEAKNYKAARRKCEDLAKRNHMPAQYNLGLMYKKGLGVPRSYVFAYMWFNIAALNGDESSVNERDGFEKEMTKASIAKAQKLSRELYKEILRINRK